MTAQHFHKELNGIEEKRASKIELNTIDEIQDMLFDDNIMHPIKTALLSCDHEDEMWASEIFWKELRKRIYG